MKDVILYGRHAVLEALKNPQRKINRLLVTKENAAEIKGKIHPEIADKKEFDRILPPDAVHQGFALFAQPLENLQIEDVIALANQKENCCVLILDQVTDPQNVGAIIRSAVAFDTLALVMQDKNSPLENGAMAKASAGMIEHLPVCRVTNLSRAIGQLKEAGFWTIGMDSHAKQAVSQVNKAGKNAIIMGSEGKGMRRLVEENCDLTVRLPISKNVESLNVSTATAIVLYELNRKEN